ncbi:hypothetical protein KBC40_00930 [Patescibacteria group bacterium]|jgi:hypothetical protein|nr:hypothetical protein [Patescibacteria group bacterium]
MKLTIRKVINFLSIILIIVSVYFFFNGHSIFVSLGYLAFAGVLFLPRTIYRRLGLHENISNEFLDWIEIGFSAIMLLSVAGYIWLFDNIYHYDTYVHFFTPLALFILFAIFFKAGTLHLKIKTTKSDLVLATLVVAMSFILLWELFEYIVTVYLNKNMFFTVTEPNDTLYDVLLGFMSLPVSSVLVYKYSDWFFDKFKK